MANQIVVSAGAKVRNLSGVLTATSGVVSSLPIDGSLGIPQLDVNGKILVSQLPNSVMEYKGTWNISTNTPTLVNGTGNQGDVYLVEGAAVGGTAFNFGAGPITFFNGDQAIYSGSIWQRASGATGTVTSVAITESGDSLNITGSPITTSGTINIGFNGTNLQYVNGAGNLTTFPTLITSIGLSMPSAFSVANSPLTANGTIAVTGAGYASQYIRGDGTLADFPSSGGGGSSVSYYLNGGTSQGTIGGVTYYEMSKTADTGTGVDFTKSGDGFIVAFLTDANDPAQLNIPAGNWNYEIYASMSANGGTPQMYAELYKYDGTTFTLIATSTNEILYDGTNLNLYTFGMTVPATTLTLTDRLAIKLYATNSGGKTTTVHTQDSHLCQVITTFSTGITALNGLTAQVQYFQTGTSGTDFNISSTTATHTFNLPTASAANRGALSSADWSSFNSKESALTFSYPLSRVGNTISIPIATASTDGYLTDTDWFIFNSKQAALSGTGFVKISGTTISYDNSTYYLASNPSAFIALTALSAGTGISYNNTTGVITSTITQYTDALARAALSFTAGSGAYNSTTGVITIPTDNNQIANGAGYITSSALSGYLPLTGGTLTGALNINLSSGTALNVAGNAIFRGDTGVGTPRQLIITSGGSTPVYLEAKGYGANYQTDFGIKTFNSVGTAFEVFYADSSGRVGINQTSPSYQLDVNGTFRAVGAATFGSSVTTGGTITLNAPSANYATLNLNGASGYGAELKFGEATGGYLAAIKHNYNVGTGLEFYTGGTGAGSLRLYIAPTGAATFTASASAPQFYISRSEQTNQGFSIQAGGGETTFNSYEGTNAVYGEYVFKSTKGSTTVERMRINGSGNVGIGTTNPTRQLFVNSTAFFDNNGDGSTTNPSIAIGSTSVGISYIGGGNLAFLTGATERMRITSGGQVSVTSSGSTVFNLLNTAGASNKSWRFVTNNDAAGDITFQQSTTAQGSSFATKMSITNAGNVLIGTTTDNGYKLYVDGGSSSGMAFYSTSPGNQFKIAGSAAAMTFSNTISAPSMGGSLGVATSAGDFLSGTAAGDTIFINQFSGKRLYAVSYSGGVYLSSGATSWTANSDIRLKNINSHIENAVEKLSTLQTINFSYKDDKTNKQNLGLIAQEVEKIFPELIDKNGDGMLGVRYTELVPVLIKAVQELKLEIETLKNK